MNLFGAYKKNFTAEWTLNSGLTFREKIKSTDPITINKAMDIIRTAAATDGKGYVTINGRVIMISSLAQIKIT